MISKHKNKGIKAASAKPAGDARKKTKRLVVQTPAEPRKAANTGSKKIHRAGDIKTKERYLQTVGRRKTAIARLRLSVGANGKFTINDKDYKKYFSYSLWQDIAIEPLLVVGLNNEVEISVKVSGGGLPSQAEAVRLALARALVLHNSERRPVLRKMGFLTRDSREKERKKPGLKRARRAPQWQKR